VDIIIISSNVTYSRHNKAEQMLIRRKTTITHSITPFIMRA